MLLEKKTHISAKLINAVQLGILDEVLNTTLSDIEVTEPVPDPADPSWSTITATLDSGVSYTLTIQVPDRVEMVQSPIEAYEYSPMMSPAVLHMLDTGVSTPVEQEQCDETNCGQVFSSKSFSLHVS